MSLEFEENLQQSYQFLSDHEEELVEFSNLDTQEHFQQILFSSMTEQQSDLHDKTHVTSHDFNDGLQQYYQVLCDPNRDEDNVSNFPSCHSSSEFFSHEKVYENHA